MTEQKADIERLLEQLRHELTQLDDQPHASQLRSLTEQIEHQITADLSTDEQSALIHEMNNELVEFEVHHPTVAGLVRNALRMLGNIGI